MSKGAFMATYNNARTIQTKFMLKKALFEILSERNVNEINVKNLCNRAEINRSTFYLHYKDIDELLKTIKQEEVNRFYEFTSSISNEKSMKEATISYFSYIKNNDFIFRVLLNGQHPDFERQFLTALLRIDYLESDIYDRIFSISGYLAITKHWIETNYQESVEDMALKAININSRLSKEVTH